MLSHLIFRNLNGVTRLTTIGRLIAQEMTAKLKAVHHETHSALLFDFLNNKQFPYMCIYMNLNVESHLPLAKNLLHLYLYCVCPFSQIRSSVFSYRVSCELKFCPQTRSWQHDYSHLNENLCCFSNLIRTPRKKKLRGIISNLKKLCFVPNSKQLMPFWRLMVQVSIGNRKGVPDKLLGKTIPLWKVSRKKSRETREWQEVMSSTGSCLDTRPVSQLYNWLFYSKPHPTNQTNSTWVCLECFVTINTKKLVK